MKNLILIAVVFICKSSLAQQETIEQYQQWEQRKERTVFLEERLGAVSSEVIYNVHVNIEPDMIETVLLGYPVYNYEVQGTIVKIGVINLNNEVQIEALKARILQEFPVAEEIF
jgi:hypothetical protein